MPNLKKRRFRDAEENICLLDRALSTIYIVGEITPRMATKFRKFMRSLNGKSKSTAITVEINSPGGDMEAGLAIADTIRLSKAPVTTCAAGQASSMASVILAVGKHRQALKNTTIMVHQGSFGMQCQSHELDGELAECKRLEKITWDLLDDFSKKSRGYWKKLSDRKNKYMSAAEAKAEGLIDEVL